jgi:2-alkyl-3-oxoalkanoate reductase
VPDRWIVEAVNARLAAAWERLAARTGARPDLAPRLDRSSLHWMAADHYYDTRRLAGLGWRPRYPISTSALPETIQALLAKRLLPAEGTGKAGG